MLCGRRLAGAQESLCAQRDPGGDRVECKQGMQRAELSVIISELSE